MYEKIQLTSKSRVQGSRLPTTLKLDCMLITKRQGRSMRWVTRAQAAPLWFARDIFTPYAPPHRGTVMFILQ